MNKSNAIILLANTLRIACGYRFPRLGKWAMDLFYALIPQYFEAKLFPNIRAVLNKNDLTQRSTYWQGIRFEHPTAQILKQWIDKDTTHFFDIGSNYGFFSYWMYSQSSEIEIHSFEPNPSTFAIVEQIKSLNELKSLHPWNMGLGEVQEKLSLHPGSDDSGHSTFGNHPGLTSAPIADIEVLPFSEWASQNDLAIPKQPAWIAKIDVEGFELKVLRGMEEALKRRSFQGIAVEVNEFTLEFCGSKPEEITDFLQSCGYKQISSAQCGNAFFVPA